MAGSYVKVGRGDHHVIALHGWFGSALGWGSLTDYLNTAQFGYVFPDLRGYGSRRDEAGEFTMAEAAADAIALADSLGWDRFSLVGHSMSGVAIQHVLLQAPHRSAWPRCRPPACRSASRSGRCSPPPPPARPAAR
jgi:pimeloyl-ACP methyl ester carboxylesterase